MKPGDVVLVDFGSPSEPGEPDKVRPSVVVSAEAILGMSAVVVVPITRTRRGWDFEVEVANWGVAQCHIITTRSRKRVTGETGENVGAAVLAQIREIIALTLDV